MLWLVLAAAVLAQDRVERKIEGSDRPVLAFVPRTPNPGLVMALHGTGGSGPGFAGGLGVDTITAAGYLVVAPTSIHGAWGNQFKGGDKGDLERDVKFLRKVLDTFIAEYKVHPDRIHLIGFSAGGFMSCLLAGFRDEMNGLRIRSACAHSGGFTTEMTAKVDRAKDTSVWVLNGQADRAHTTYSKNMYEAFHKSGYDAKFTEVPGRGHSFPLAPMSEILEWWRKLDKDAPDISKFEAAMKKGSDLLEKKQYGQAHKAFEEAKKAAGKAAKYLQPAEEALAKIEAEGRRLLDEAAAARENEPDKAKQILKDAADRFKGTTIGEEARKSLKDLQ